MLCAAMEISVVLHFIVKGKHIDLKEKKKYLKTQGETEAFLNALDNTVFLNCLLVYSCPVHLGLFISYDSVKQSVPGGHSSFFSKAGLQTVNVAR